MHPVDHVKLVELRKMDVQTVQRLQAQQIQDNKTILQQQQKLLRHQQLTQ